MGKKSNIFRLPKILRSPQKDIGEIGNTTEEKLDEHFFKRLTNLTRVRRFVIAWLVLMGLLILIGFLQFNFLRDQYQKLNFVPGGTFREGIVGSYSNANPIYASSSVDSSVSRLVFSGLFTYDSEQNLTPALAESMKLDKSEKRYTVKLKENLTWHDGQPLTAEDVVFTFQTIQNPEAKSYLQPSWEGVEVKKTDDHTVVFALPNILGSFPYSLTTGILPKHLLESIPAEQLRSSDFNTIKPIGSGPFKFDTVEVKEDEEDSQNRQERIGLLANDGYFRGRPGISQYIISTYENQDELIAAYDDKEVNAIAGLGEVKDEYVVDQNTNIYSVPIAGQTMVFFKNDGILADGKVRKALVFATDRQDVINSTGQVLKSSDSPLLSSQVGYDKKYTQKTGNIKAADKLLKKAGWKMDPDKGVRFKKKKELTIRLFGLSNNEYEQVAGELKEEWAKAGINLEVSLQDEEVLKSTVAARSYDALLSTISIGADPDVFAFWHSSQAEAQSKTQLNFSEYVSKQADSSLEAGRSRTDPKLREVKYKAFLKAWHKDNPALALYQPNYTFLVRSPFEGFNNESLVNPIYRYTNVSEWLIKRERS